MNDNGMVERITKLTEAQEALLPIWRDKWIAIGQSTAPAERKRAEAAYRACYRYAKLDDKVPVIWVSSPIVGVFAAPIAAISIAYHNPAVGSAVDPAVDPAVGSAVYSAVRSAVYSAVGSAIYSAVGSAVDSAVRSAVYSAVRSAVRSAALFWHAWDAGPFWCSWQAYESYFRQCCGLCLPGDLVARAEAYATTAQAAGYWWPNRYFIMACERPRMIKLREGRLHAENGHAIEWQDGWGLSAWRGIVVPDVWMAGNPPSPSEILKWPNLEQRRAACEIVGWEAILRALPNRTVDQDADPQIGNLVEVMLPNTTEPQRFLRVLCGTGRYFTLRVPRECETALQANAWSYSIPENLLQLKEFRT